MKKRLLVPFFFILLMVAFLNSSMVFPADKPPKEIKIGASLAITGPFSVEWGPPTLKYSQALESVVNERGGVYVKEYNTRLPIKLIIYDDGSSPDRSVELYEKLATVDKADFFIGPESSPILIKASTIAEKYGIPMIGSCGNSPYIFARGFKWLVGVDMPAPQWGETYYAMIKQLMDTKQIPQLKTVAVIKEETPHTMDVGLGAEHYAKIAGLEVVSSEKIPQGLADFSSIIIKWKGLKPDIVYVASWSSTAATFAKQAHETGFKPFTLHIPHVTLTTVWHKKVGPEIAEGVTGITHIANFKSGDVQLYNEAIKRTGLGPYDLGIPPNRFLSLEVLLKGIEKAGTLNRAKVMDAIKTLRYQTLHGEMFFRFGYDIVGKKCDGVGNKPVYIAQLQGGEIKVLWPLELAEGKYKRR